MSEASRRDAGDVPERIDTDVREACLALPDADEERAWVGVRWKIRTRTFAHVLGIAIDGGEVGHADPLAVLAFRSAGAELEMLRHGGLPLLQLGWAATRSVSCSTNRPIGTRSPSC